MARREKKVGGDPTLLLMLLAGCGIVGVVLIVVFAGLKKKNPIISNPGKKDYLVAPRPKDGIDPEQPTWLKTNDPRFRAFQTWQQAKIVARKYLNKALKMCEDTISDVPEYAGDAYFSCVQCIEYYLETKTYIPYQKGVPRSRMPITKSELKSYYDREFSYYRKAIEAYSQPGAKTMLGIDRKPESQIRRIEEAMRDKKEKIIPWWLDHLPD